MAASSAQSAPPAPRTAQLPPIAFDNSYARELEGCYLAWPPAAVPAPRLVYLNRTLAEELGLNADALASEEGAAMFAGNALPEGAAPLAQAYAGHQFGGFSPQLGDGRALLLGEVIDEHGQRRDIAFKGSGRTPFSRNGDGKAALGPVLREVLIGEAMQALGIPTTRALAAVATGEPVRREQLLPGAVLTRVAASHLRVGTFQFFAARQDLAHLRQLVDYALARHDPALAARPDRDGRAVALLQAVVARQAELIARWMGVGFIHGVMNTDNMTISGETIDYGPCAFMEGVDPATVFSSIDHHGRYAYGNQPGIAQWNLARLAEALLPLIDPDADRAVALATETVNAFMPAYQERWLEVMRRKLGLSDAAPQDMTLAEDFLSLLQQHQVDFTLGFRRLLDCAEGRPEPLLTLFGEAAGATLSPWLQRWQARLGTPGPAALQTMRRANPIYIARNHQVEAALAAAVERDDLAPFERLLAVLQQPFDEREEDAKYALPAPPEQTRCYQTFCGT